MLRHSPRCHVLRWLLRLLQEQRSAGGGQCCRWLPVQQAGVRLQRLWLPRIASHLGCPGSCHQRLRIKWWRWRCPQPQRLLQHAGAKASADGQAGTACQWLCRMPQWCCKRLAEKRRPRQGCRRAGVLLAMMHSAQAQPQRLQPQRLRSRQLRLHLWLQRQRLLLLLLHTKAAWALRAGCGRSQAQQRKQV